MSEVRRGNGRSNMKRWLTYALGAVMIFIIASNLYLGVRKAVTGETVPKLLGFAPLIVISGSMEPAFMPGDIVLIRERPAEAYAVGNVVSYAENGLVYTHRIVRTDGEWLILKGDHNNVEDDPITRDQILGQAVFVFPVIGRLVLWLRTPAGMGMLGLALLAVVLIEWPAREEEGKGKDA